MHKTITLIIAAVILYTIVQTKIYPPKPAIEDNKTTEDSLTIAEATTEQSNPQLTGNFIEKTISKVVINTIKTEEGRQFLEHLLQPMNKPLSSENYTVKVRSDLVTPLFQLETHGVGTLGPAACGHVVSVRYRIYDIDGTILTENTKTFTLGARPIMPGMDSVIVGMMVGQTRQAVIPARYAYYDKKYKDNGLDPESPYKLNVTLQSILPKNFIHDNEVKIFDDEIAYRTPLLCGDQVSFDAKITRLSDGKILYDSIEKNKKIEMKIGDISYPLAFSCGLHGKVPVGTRTIITKSTAFKPLGSNVSRVNLGTLTSEEYLMLELGNFEQ